MTLLDVLQDKREPRQISDKELNQMMQILRDNHCWRGPYFKLDSEQQRRAVRRWVREDVFGNTFGE